MIGTVTKLESSGQPMVYGVVRGSSQLSPTSPPVRIGAALTSTVDGNGNSLYGTNAIQGFVLNQTQYETPFEAPPTTPGIPSWAVEVPLRAPTRAITAALEWRQTIASTSRRPPRACRSAAGAPPDTTGYFGGIMNTTAQVHPT
jgi:hypothetical protein